jgi:two-component system, chemotaxis family, sensor kinase CheA
MFAVFRMPRAPGPPARGVAIGNGPMPRQRFLKASENTDDRSHDAPERQPYPLLAMSIQPLLDRLASALTCLTPGDGDSLSALARYCEEVAAEVDLGGPLGEPIARALECARRLAKSGDADPGGDLRLLEEIVTWAQDAVEAMEDGQTVAAFGASAPAAEDPVDMELLGMFLDSANEALQTIEGELLELESDPHQPERITEVRGVVHTLKGECGVIPLSDAQSLLHRAETALDQATTTGNVLPVDLFLSLVDWMKSYCDQLAEDPGCAAPEHRELRDRIEAAAEGRTLTPAKPAIPAAAVDSKASAFSQTERVLFPEDVLGDPTIAEFLTEARSHLEDSEAALLEVENDPENIELVDRIFRAFHTIKGVAGFMNMEDMVQLAHNAEALLDEFRKGRMLCTPIHISLIFESCDSMNAMLDYLAGNEAPLRAGVYQIIDRLEAASKGAVDIGATAPQAASAPAPAQAAATPEALPEDPPMLGDMLVERGLLSHDQLEACLTEQRQLEAAGKPKHLGQILNDHALLRLDDLKAALREQTGGKAAEEAHFPFAEVLVEAGLLTAAEVKTTVAAPVEPLAAGSPKKKKARIEHTVKVATGRLDTLVDMVGELVIAQQMVSQDPELEGIRDPRLHRNLSQVAKITRDLQESAMSLRMVTLRSTFQKMTRLVRDVSNKSGKSVDLVVAGEETELDRNVVEEIGDPLVHLIRNAIDHGLEPPDERIDVNKSPRGQVDLKAYHQGGSIVIEIRDDGRGMDPDRILAKAVERGLLPADTTRDDISEADIHRLILAPGFSTAETVTDISGRGVGMDVVRRNIEAMRGKIDIESKLGQGSAFLLKLPLTLAIIDGMIVRVGDRRYVIPTLAIEQSFRPAPGASHRVMNDGEMIEVRGKLLPIHRLGEIFHLDGCLESIEEGILVVIDGAGERACLFVDEILGQQQVVIKNLGKALPQTEGISGGAILGDGLVALILDIDGLLTNVTQETIPQTIAS